MDSGLGLPLFALVSSLQLFYLYSSKSLKSRLSNSSELVSLTGGCHCKKVRFEVTTSSTLVTWVCNCSICDMRKNWHFIVPFSDFKITQGEDNLNEYTFNTGQAKHLFCKTCGITSFYRPRSNPDGVAVTLSCVDDTSGCVVVIRDFDGQNWEHFYGGSNIQQFSKVKSTNAV